MTPPRLQNHSHHPLPPLPSTSSPESNPTNRLVRCPVMEDLRNVYPDEFGRIRMVFPRQRLGPIDAEGPLFIGRVDYGSTSFKTNELIEKVVKEELIGRASRSHDYGELI